MISILSLTELCQIDKINDFFWTIIKTITLSYSCFIFISIILSVLAIQYENTHNFLNNNVIILIFLFFPPSHFFCNIIYMYFNNKTFTSIQENKKYLSILIKILIVFTFLHNIEYFAIANYILYLNNNFENIMPMFLSSIFGFIITQINLVILLSNLHYFYHNIYDNFYDETRTQLNNNNYYQV